MSEKKNCIRLVIAKEEDRQTVAGILVKNGYAVKYGKGHKTTMDWKKSKALTYYLIVEGTEDCEW